MNALQTFTYQQSTVRTVERDGEPWFVLKDVCDVLNLTTPARVAERLDKDEVSQTHLTDSIGRQQDTTVINESGLYSVILRSDKPEAKPFRKWVTSEVIPSIRRTGSYQKKQLTPAEQLLAQAGVLVEQERRIAALEQSAEQTRKGIALIAAPAATGKDTWQDETGHAIRQMCKEYSLNYQTTTGDLYRELEERAGCDLEARKRNLQKTPAHIRRDGGRVQSCLQADRHCSKPAASRDFFRRGTKEGGNPLFLSYPEPRRLTIPATTTNPRKENIQCHAKSKTTAKTSLTFWSLPAANGCSLSKRSRPTPALPMSAA